jgi:hypothetical protein
VGGLGLVVGVGVVVGGIARSLLVGLFGMGV